MSHVSDGDLMAFGEDSLGVAKEDVIREHIGRCDDCLERFLALMPTIGG